MSPNVGEHTTSQLAQDVRDQVVSMVRVLGDKGLTVGFAESCTGGLLSSFVTELSGVSQVFTGSIISYDNKIKQKVLGVSKETLSSFGAVSSETATEMVKGALASLDVQVAASITGIAGPTGGTPTKPVGTVLIAVGGMGREPWVKKCSFSGDRRQIQLQSCLEALKLLNQWLKEN